MDLMALRGAVFGKYKNQLNFGDAIKWNRNKVSRLLRGKYIPDVDEAAQINHVMNLSEEEYKEIFLPALSPNGATDQEN